MHRTGIATGSGLSAHRRPVRRCRPPGTLGLLALYLLAAGCSRPARAPSELRVGLGYSFGTLDPHAESAVTAFEQLANVYEPLATVGAEARIVPLLAQSWASPDPFTWVFTLRSAVRFHDGRPLTSKDVVTTLERLKDDGRLGIHSRVAWLASAAATSPSTVVVRTRWPNAQILGDLSFVLVVPDGSTGASLAARANGTGPYAVEGWQPGQSLALRRNETWWGGRPELQRVEVEMGVAGDVARSRFEEGRYGLLREAFPGVSAAAAASGRFEEIRSPNLFLRHLGFDVARERTPHCPVVPNPFTRIEVRQAVELALDRTRLARAVGPEASPASQLVPRSVFGHDPSLGPRPHDPERARRLLAEAGLGHGFEVVLHRPRGFTTAAEEVKRQLAEVGVRVTVVSLPSPDFFAALRRGELTFWIVADGCTTGDAQEILSSAFHSRDGDRGLGADNRGGLRDGALDRVIEQAATLSDPSARLPLLRTALRMALESLAWIPLYHSVDSVFLDRAFTLRLEPDLLLRYAGIVRRNQG